ncbi:alcohol dehydrogenase catalytic domain-containing protein [Chloroflexota bacterium]
MKVKAAVCREYKAPLSIEELDLADPKEHEVLVGLEACGFCHSDLSFMEGNVMTNLPIVLGHEPCGIVEKVGLGVTKVKPGDRVIGIWMAPCGQCFQCLRGRPQICEGTIKNFGSAVLPEGTSRFTDKNGKPVGLFGFLGGFATHTVIPEISAIRVPEHIKTPPSQLCQLGCSVLTGWGSVANAIHVGEGTSLGVWGCGGIGLNVIRTAALRNCRPLVAVDLEASKRDIAMEFGATHFIDSSKNDPIPIIQELTGGYGLEYALEAIGDPGAQIQAWWSLRSGGTLVAIGITPEGSTTNLPITFIAPHVKTIKGALYGNTHPVEDIPMMAEFMSDGTLKTDKLVTRLIKLEDIEEARRAMLAREIIGRWVISYE